MRFLRSAGSNDAGGSAGPIPAPHRPLRVLLVDDHLMARCNTRKQLDEIPRLRVIGEAADGFEAVALARTLAPDLVVMDVTMPGMNGIEATRRIKEQFPWMRVLILTFHEPAEVREEALAAGAAAVLGKGESTQELAVAIQELFKPWD